MRTVKYRGKEVPDEIMMKLVERVKQGPFTATSMRLLIGDDLLQTGHWKPYDVETIINRMMGACRDHHMCRYDPVYRQWVPTGAEPEVIVPETVGSIHGADLHGHEVRVQFGCVQDATKWLRFFRNYAELTTPVLRKKPQMNRRRVSLASLSILDDQRTHTDDH